MKIKSSQTAMWIAMVMIVAILVALATISNAQTQTTSQSTTSLECLPPCTATTTFYYTLTGSNHSFQFTSVLVVGLVLMAALVVIIALVRSVDLTR